MVTSEKSFPFIYCFSLAVETVSADILYLWVPYANPGTTKFILYICLK